MLNCLLKEKVSREWWLTPITQHLGDRDRRITRWSLPGLYRDIMRPHLKKNKTLRKPQIYNSSLNSTIIPTNPHSIFKGISGSLWKFGSHIQSGVQYPYKTGEDF
jgi:hypothetical protein